MKTPFTLALLLIPFTLFATEETSSTALQELTQELNEITQTATEQRVNIDYLPYIMSVFEGDELSHAGATSLKDALSLVAGVSIASDNLSLFNPIFRGSNPEAHGQTKLIIDGIETNELLFDSHTSYLAMPIELIKRMEVVRGPGSYSDGHWGYAGSVIITTYKKEEIPNGQSGRWFASSGSYGTRKAGGSYSLLKNDFSLGADVYTIHDNLALNYGKDALSNGYFGANNVQLSRSGSAPLGTDTTVISATIAKGSLFVDGRFSLYRHGGGGGITYALASDGDHYTLNQGSFHLGTHYTLGNFSGTIQGSMTDDRFGNYGLTRPAGLVLAGVTYPDGFYSVNEVLVRTYGISNTLSGNLFWGERDVWDQKIA